ncbi:MAG: sulfatase-like hydrolase/transferase [Candidatus Omnitrophota bacterium]
MLNPVPVYSRQPAGSNTGIYAEEYSPYGVMTHFERRQLYPPQDIRRACKLIKDAGIQWVLTCFNWKDIEPRKGKFDFSATDKVVEIASSHNLEILPLLWLCPDWAASPRSGADKSEIGLFPPGDAEEFANFAYRAAKRYKGRIKYWQIWGEENNPHNWRPEPDPKEYLNLLKASYKKIKKADPGAKIVLGSLALKNLEGFLEKIYQLGGREYFDILAINPYVHPTLNYDPYSDKTGEPVELVKDWVFKIRRLMGKYGDSLKPLWITEIGSPGQEEPGDWWLLGTTPTEEQQAEWVKRVYTELLEEDLADKIFWYNFRTPPDESSASAGLVETDFRIKPAYLAYKALPKLKSRHGLNVFLISVDSLRPDHLSCYGYPRPTTPTLDSLVREGIKFTQAVSTAPWTSPSLISLLTSTYPPVHGVDGRAKSLPEGIPTPVKKLKQAGYLVPGISYIHTVLNYKNLGFDVVEEPTGFKQKDEEIKINQWLEKNHRKRFFFWHHFYAPHLPYDPQPEFEKIFVKAKKEYPEDLKQKLELIRNQPVIRAGQVDFTEKDLPYIVPLYDAEIRQADAQIGSVIKKLEQLGILHKTILIITADHGEEFLEHGNIGHASTTLAGNLFEECIRIPLIFWNPEVLPAGKIINQQVQNIDVMPTVFELLSLNPDIPIEGKSLVPVIRNNQTGPVREYAFSDTTPGGFQSTQEQETGRIRSIRTERWKLIHSYAPERQEVYMLFDLKEDPEEKKNVIKEHPGVAENLTSKLREWSFVCLTKSAWFQAKTRERESPGIPEALLGELKPPKVLSPLDGSILKYSETGGRVVLRWDSPARLWYIVEYDIGKENLKMKGSFPVKGNQQTFGPIPEDVWGLLQVYNPWKFRIKVKGREDLHSKWAVFNFSSN